MTRRRIARQIQLVLACACLALALNVSPASASKQVYNYFGTSSGSGSNGGEFNIPLGVSVNNTGAGPADAGDVYVVDGYFPIQSNRIQRFSRDAEGEYHFVSAWGAGVQSGGTDYEVCTVAANCHAAIASGGNGTVAGNGGFNRPTGIAVDQDTGEVYIIDSFNARVNVYTGDGIFLRSFGFDVVASGPGEGSGPEEEQQLTVKATGGRFSLSFDGKTTGTTGTGKTVNGSKTISKVVTTSGTFTVGQPISPTSGFGIPTGTTITAVGAETLTISKAATNSTNLNLLADNFAHDASAAQLEATLNALSTIGGVGGSVTVTGGPGDLGGTSPYTIHFGGALSGEDVPQIAAHSGLTITSGFPSADVLTSVPGGVFEVCRAAAGDICKAGSTGGQVGQIGNIGPPNFESAASIAINPPDDNPASGKVYLADQANGRVNAYDLDGSSLGSFGSGVFNTASGGWSEPKQIAIDSRGIVYATNRVISPIDPNDIVENKIERYDTENANGGGVGFLTPIANARNEQQLITIDASSGQYRLTFGGQTTNDITYLEKLAFNEAGTIESELEALSSVGASNVTVSAIKESNPRSFRVKFTNALAGQDVEQIAASNGTTPLSGGTGASVTIVFDGHAVMGFSPSLETPFAVDPDTDGGGPDTDVLYLLHSNGIIDQLGPVNKPGLSAPPTAFDDEHGTTSQLGSSASGVALDEASGDLYVTNTEAAGNVAHGVYVLGQIGPPPTASLDSIDGVTATTAAVHATINPNGPANVSYAVEYSLDGIDWESTAKTLVGSQVSPQAVSTTLNPLPGGLQPNTLYHVRIVATKPGNAPVITSELTFTTLGEAPSVETTGSPVRTAITAQLNGRINPRNTATTYRFEYGTQGPCDVNACVSTAAQPAGSGNEIELVSEEVEGLESDTTYHYRVVGESSAPGSPSYGEDMTVTTRASDAPLSHGHLAGPAGSDRAYEQVNMPDTGGNPLTFAPGFSADGNRALYRVAGGTPISDTGSFVGIFFAQRTASGWQTESVGPPRAELVGSAWDEPAATADLGTILAANKDLTTGQAAIWKMAPQAQPSSLFAPQPPQKYKAATDAIGAYGLSADGSRAIVVLSGGELDPAYPGATAVENIYDISSGSPQLVGLLPGGAVPACGVIADNNPFGLPQQASHWVSPDGSEIVFPSRGDNCSSGPQLFERDLGAEVTRRISPPALSGPTCGVALVKATPGGIFFWTQNQLVAEDTKASGCDTSGARPEDGDVYRYDSVTEALECLTCVVAGVDADVLVSLGSPTGARSNIAVAEDGSRVYFSTEAQLLAGAPEAGASAYRVNVASGELAYVAPLNFGGSIGEITRSGQALSANGATLLFRSDAPGLDAIGGSQNGATKQYYLYDDRDRSLTCASCPQDGDEPSSEVREGVASVSDAPELGITPLSADGRTFAFTTPTALVGADQNTPGVGEDPNAGTDVYEWRDGRLFLISDGLRNWPGSQVPLVQGVSPSGEDIFFMAAAQYTPDALDAYNRLYDARIGGGFEFPVPPPPCPLEVCQGTPKGAPEEQAPGSGSFAGPGNSTPKPPARACPKGKRKGQRGGKARCVNKKGQRKGAKRHQRANHERRTSR